MRFFSLIVPLNLMYLRPTVGQSAHKFFENTRDSGNGEFEMVSTRLPKNFRSNRPTLSASKFVRKQEGSSFLNENCGIN
jgi:hypothetical protein